MDVVLNTDSLRPPISGIGRYTTELLKGLAAHPAIGQVHRFYGMGFGPPPATAPVPRTLVAALRGLPLAYEMRQALQGRIFDHRTRALAATVYHEPSFILKPCRLPAVATIHDLSFLRFPEFHPPARARFLTRHIAHAVRTAAHIIADSPLIADEIVTFLGVPRDKISVIPLGVDPAFRPMDPEGLRPFLAGYGLEPENYLLSVGTLEPRKNLAAVMEAYARLDEKTQRRFPLVVAGQAGWGTYADRNLVEKLVRKGVVRHVGYLPDESLVRLYAGATLFVYASLYEGFGLPALEAMAAGLPVIGSLGTAVAGLAGGAGLLVEPKDPAAIAAAMAELLADGEKRRRLGRLARERALAYQWDATVEKTITVYGKVL